MALAGAASPPEEDCDGYYYGISGAPDFVRALRCYEAEQRWEMLIPMHLNGEGTPADVGRAEELLLAWQKQDPSQADSLQVQAFRTIIDERKQHPGGPFAHVDFCDDVAGDTVNMNSCAALYEEMENAKLRARLAKIRSGLTAAQGVALDKVVAEFKVFQLAEGRRMYQQYIDGTIRGIASFGQKDFVRDQFSTLIQDTVERRGLQPADRGAYEAADRELNQVYRDDLRAYTDEYEELFKDGSKEYRDLHGGHVEKYKKDSKDAQIHWIRYRDLCAELARLLYKGKKAAFDPALSMKTAVTRIRVLELRNDPIGPGDEEKP